MVKQLTTEHFIQKAIKIHGNKYDYSKVVYVNSYTKICIICPEHGKFWQTPINHLSGKGCKKCANTTNGDNHKNDLKTLIGTANKIHNNKYDYSRVNYKTMKDKVCIVCPEHGKFWQSLNKHIYQRHGCPQCGIQNRANKRLKSFESFLKEANTVHKDKYEYDETSYKMVRSKMRIICPEHGEFWQTPNKHLQGQGCPECAKELNVKETNLFHLLSSHFPNEEIIHIYKNCQMLGNQSIDLYFPKYKLGIEYQGREHFCPVDIFGGEDGYENTVKRDITKIKKCQNNNIKLYHFTFDKNDIKEHYRYTVYTDVNILFSVIEQDISEYKNK